MRRYATLIALAACSTKTIEHDAAPLGDPAPQVAAPQTGQHGAAIELIAISDDGSAAITQDARGGTRLWPALDGTSEPVVVTMSFAASLAIGRTPNGFVVTARDDSAGLEILELDAAGRVLARTRVSPDPALRDVVIDRGRVLALRADQILVEYAPNGRIVMELPAPAGEHIARLVTRNGRVLAIAERAGIWLEGSTWGATTVRLPLQPGPFSAALSPSGRLLALSNGTSFTVTDLVAVTQPLADSSGAGITGVGFVDDRQLVVQFGSGFEWRQIYGGDPWLVLGSSTNSQIAWGNGQVLRGAGRSIELNRKAEIRYLGYESHVGPVASSELLAMLPPDPRPLTDIKELDDDHVLVTRGAANGIKGLAVFDRRTRTYNSDLSTAVGRDVQRYEPSTGLLVLGDQIASYLVQYDRTTHEFETWYRIEYEASDLHVLDPARTHGAVAIAVRTDTDKTKVRIERFYATDLLVGAPIRSGDVTSHAGTFVGLDADGRAYIADGRDIVVYDGAREVRRYVGVKQTDTARVVVGPSVALIDGDMVALLDDFGIERWRVVAPVTDVTWEGTTLVGVFATGSATFDLVTGALGGRTCGWGFGIRNLPRENSDEDSICEAR